MDGLELLRSAYAHVSRTSSWPWEMFAPDAKFDLSAATGPVTDDQREVREAWRQYAGCFESFKIEPEEFLEAEPNQIVAVVRDSGRPKGSSQDIHSEHTHVWTFGWTTRSLAGQASRHERKRLHTQA